MYKIYLASQPALSENSYIQEFTSYLTATTARSLVGNSIYTTLDDHLPTNLLRVQKYSVYRTVSKHALITYSCIDEFGVEPTTQSQDVSQAAQ